MQLNKNTLIFGLIFIVAAVFFYKDWETDKWKGKYETELQKVPDTVEVVLTLTDTLLIEKADSSEFISVSKNDTTFVYKILYDVVKQPLFTLNTVVNSKDETFKYDFNYNPLKIQLIFKDKYDLQKGFEVTTTPDVGKVFVDWGDYTPAKKAKKFKFSVGLGYSKELGPILLSGIQWKKNEIGVFMKENSYGFYFKRTFLAF